MKYCFCIYLFILAIFNSCCRKPEFAQYDKGLLEFIKKNGDYIQLSDYDNLPEQLKSYYINIQYFLFFQGESVDSFFVSVQDNYIYGDSVQVFLNYVGGFIGLKRAREDCAEQNRIAELTGKGDICMIQLLGMRSERDGELILDKRSGQFRRLIKYK